MGGSTGGSTGGCRIYLIFEDNAMLRLRLIIISSFTYFYDYNLKEVLFEQPSPLGALSRRFESYRPDQL